MRNGITNVKSAAALFPITRYAIGKASIPPMIPVPITSPIYANGSFFPYLYKRPASKAPHILPGNASGLPSPRRLRINDAIKACASAHHGPTVTAQIIFTKCCTGAHFEPNTGNENRLPTTAIAAKIAVIVNFLILVLFMLTSCV